MGAATSSRVLRPRAAANQAALLFAISGGLALVALPFPGPTPRPVLLAVAAADFLAAGLIRMLPWERWSGWTLLGIVLPALGVIAAVGTASEPSPAYGVFFVLLFVWIGLYLPRGASLILAPAAVVAYALPLDLHVLAGEAWTIAVSRSPG